MDDHHWRPNNRPINNSSKPPSEIENIDFPALYKGEITLGDVHADNTITNVSARSEYTSSFVDSHLEYSGSGYKNFGSFINPQNTPININNYRSGFSKINPSTVTNQRPLFSRTFEDRAWRKDFYDTQFNRDANLPTYPSKSKTDNACKSTFDTADNHASVTTDHDNNDNLRNWKIPGRPNSPNLTSKTVNNVATNPLNDTKNTNNSTSSVSKGWEMPDSDNRCTSDASNIELPFEKSEYSLNQRSLNNSAILSNYSANDNITSTSNSASDAEKFNWDFMLKNNSEAEKLEEFKMLVAVTHESKISSIVSDLVQFTCRENYYSVFAIKALTFTLVFHLEPFILSFHLKYIEKIFSHPSNDDLGAGFLRLLLNNMAEIKQSERSGDREINYSEIIKSYTRKMLQICCNRYGCESVEMLGANRLRDWVCTFWYEIPMSIPDIDIYRLFLSWINNRHDAMYLKDGPFTLIARERDSRGRNGPAWLFGQFISFVFKSSSNISIDFQRIIQMCSDGPILGKARKNSGGQQINNEGAELSFHDCISIYLRQYRECLENDKDGIDEVDIDNSVINRYYAHILDIWIALACIPWPVRHPKAPLLQLLSQFFQLIYNEKCNNPIEQSYQFSLVKTCIRILISKIAAPINAEDAALQVVTLILHTNPPLTNDPAASQIFEGIAVFLRRRLFLWQNVDDGIPHQTVQTLQALYDLISPCSALTDDKDVEINDLHPPSFHKLQNEPLFPRNNIYKPENIELNEDVSNDILEHVASNYETYQRGNNKLEMFLNLSTNTFIKGTNDEPAGINLTNFVNYNCDLSNANLNSGKEPDLNLNNLYSGQSPISNLNLGQLANGNEPKWNNAKNIKPVVPAPGLKNLGNTCYYNSVLQALYHTDDFVATLFACEYDPEFDLMNLEVVKGLQKLFKKMLMGGKAHVNPSSSYRQLPSQFKNKCQHDATEVARYILDELGCDKISIWKGLFAGIVIQRIKCKCGYVSDTQQTILDFSFTLAEFAYYEEPSIQDLMDGFVKKEKLSGDNKYFCNKCNKNRKAEKWNVIASPPIHLMVILNRNLWEIGGDGRGSPEKNSMHVHINQVLNVCGFTYYLYGSIIHQGPGTDSGHYYFVGTRSDTAMHPEEKWYKMDDTVVLKVGPDFIEDTSRNPDNTHVPYVLFYRCNQAPSSPSIYI